LGKQKNAQNRHGEDVRETLKWLDEATSRHSNPIALQGAEDHFPEWKDVEKFVVPRTLFSENDGLDDAEIETDADAGPDEALNSLTLIDVPRKTPVSSIASAGSRSLSPSSLLSQRSSISAESPPTSPVKAFSSPAKGGKAPAQQNGTSGSSVPESLQPLFNYILWRIHQEQDPVAALESFIFLCNDPSKVNYAKGFEIKTKRLEQLREAIGREDRESKNRQLVVQREQNSSTPAVGHKPSNSNGNSATNKPPPKAPAAMLSKQSAQANVIDPDAFDRNNPTAFTQTNTENIPNSPKVRANAASPSHGGRGAPFAPRGHPRGNFRGGPRGRGNFGAPTRGGFIPHVRGKVTDQGTQIDPNSFARPRGGGYARGGRKLWVPT
jgi:hypothetical protein